VPSALWASTRVLPGSSAQRSRHGCLPARRTPSREKGWIASYEQALVGRMDVAGLLFDLEATPGRIQGPPPVVGQHTRTVLENIGYDSDRIDKLIAVGAVSTRNA